MKAYSVALILCLLPAHGAQAAGGLLVYDNGHDNSSCLAGSGALCLVSGSATGHGTVNASQRTAAIGVVVLAPLGVPLLSDSSLVIRGDDLVFPNPVTPAVAGFVGQRNMTVGDVTYLRLGMNETEFLRYGYYDPRYTDPSLAHRGTAIYYDQDADRGLQYHWFSPSDVGEDDTDHQITATVNGTCAKPVDLGAQCQAALDGAASRVMDATPNVRVGFTWEAIGAADDVEDFASGAPLSSGGSASTALPGTSQRRPAVPAPTPKREPARPDDQLEGPSPSPALPPPQGLAQQERQAEGSPLLVATQGDPAAPLPVVAVAATMLLALAFKLLYARIRSREEALEHDHRRRVLDVLAQQGPRTVAELGSALGVDRSTALYHVRVLRRSASVLLAKQDRATYVLLPGQRLPTAAAHRGGRAADEILRVLRESGAPISRARLHALAAHLPLRVRNHALRELAHSGAIVRAFAGNEETIALARGPGAAA